MPENDQQTESIGSNESNLLPGAPETGAAAVADKELDIKTLLSELVEASGSDLHLKVGQPPIFRVDGKLARTAFPTIDQERLESLIDQMIDEPKKAKLMESRELDMAYSVPGLARFRVNIFWQSNKLGMVCRVIPINIKTIEELGLPAVTKKFADLNRGLVLVTGPTGSGKSTSLAAIIDHINSTRKAHIITIEDPVEFLHKDKVAAINQRELGADTHSFAAALKHVMRQSPDVILVGELRDLETISLALTAAETGHLVFATLHTTDAAQTIDRICDVFPPEEQPRVRMQLANSLRGIVSQTLVPAINGGRLAAFEILISHSGVRNLIREGKTHQIYNLIQTGSNYGMQLLDQSLKLLLQKNVVTFDDVIAKASNPSDFESMAPRAVRY